MEDEVESPTPHHAIGAEAEAEAAVSVRADGRRFTRSKLLSFFCVQLLDSDFFASRILIQTFSLFGDETLTNNPRASSP